ncbi:uncharacterized protein MCYG_01737 [Microsporum canis CBS 113480]|uniref:Zn(2)-C6 fungal-type domain-containing protein n=1 Tax=Arthroderma otae (strain ATCC MYA-4605 / CBS 113480) TaxID=554155 RepID=C5FHT8_ARTOC|nr:uncharacterized protein MCYG_01737 [Microsporum canis CBS 113480]EEQ28918.1 predicted protein [Microsporum canis CBS 113480]
MFVTLRYGSDEGDEIRCVESTSKPPYEASPDPHFACNACRAKKLKCDGDKTGCQRCSSAGTECSYRAEKPSVKKRKHHLLSSSSKPPALPAAQSPRQSRPQPSPENERPAESTAFLQDAPSAGDIPSSSVRRPASAAVPTTVTEHADFGRELFDQYFTTLGQGDDMLSHTLQRHPVVALAEDAGMSLSTHEQPLEDDFTISTQGSPPFPGPLNPISRTISSPGTSSRGSGKTSHCASIDSSIGHNSSTNSCQCTRSALKILEVVSSHFKPAEGLYSVEQALYTLKRNIGQCQSIVQCSASGGDPGLKLLVIVLCEKMIAIFEGISAGWDRQLQAVARMKQTRPGGAAAAASAVNSAATQEDTWVSQYRRVTIGGYQIDTIEERHTVFGMLIQLQLKRLSDTIAKLSKNAMTENLESHLAILMPMNQKVKNLKAALDRTTLSHS